MRAPDIAFSMNGTMTSVSWLATYSTMPAASKVMKRGCPPPLEVKAGGKAKLFAVRPKVATESWPRLETKT